MAISNIPLSTIYFSLGILIFLLFLVIFETILVNVIVWFKCLNDIATDNENIKKIIVKLVENNKLKQLFEEKGAFRKEYMQFENAELVFTYKEYINFLINLTQTNNHFKEEIQMILNEEIVKESSKIFLLIKIFLIIIIGFIINEFFYYLSFVNDQFEEKKHLIFILFSSVYFSVLIYTMKSIDFTHYFVIKSEKNYSDEKNGNTIKI